MNEQELRHELIRCSRFRNIQVAGTGEIWIVVMPGEDEQEAIQKATGQTAAVPPMGGIPQVGIPKARSPWDDLVASRRWGKSTAAEQSAGPTAEVPAPLTTAKSSGQGGATNALAERTGAIAERFTPSAKQGVVPRAAGPPPPTSLAAVPKVQAVAKAKATEAPAATNVACLLYTSPSPRDS